MDGRAGDTVTSVRLIGIEVIKTIRQGDGNDCRGERNGR